MWTHTRQTQVWNEVNNGENKRCMKHGESGEREGVLWENERAICQHGNTSKSHRNARSACLTGRIKPRCECVRAPCITRWAYSISLIRTLWKTEHRLIATVAVNNCHLLHVIALLELCDSTFCVDSVMIMALATRLMRKDDALAKYGWVTVTVYVPVPVFVLYCESLAHCLTQR